MGFTHILHSWGIRSCLRRLPSATTWSSVLRTYLLTRHGTEYWGGGGRRLRVQVSFLSKRHSGTILVSSCPYSYDTSVHRDNVENLCTAYAQAPEQWNLATFPLVPSFRFLRSDTTITKTCPILWHQGSTPSGNTLWIAILPHFMLCSRCMRLSEAVRATLHTQK